MSLASTNFFLTAGRTLIPRLRRLTVLVAAALSAASPAASGCDDALQMREADRHYMFRFEPQYRQAECILQFDIQAKSVADAGSDLMSSIFHAASEYMLANEPVAAPFAHKFRVLAAEAAKLYILLPDDCPRRQEIGEALAKAISRTHRGLLIELHEPHPQPGPATIEGFALWIDAPGYNSDTWRLRRRAHRGDAPALLEMAKAADVDGGDDPHAATAFIYYHLALKRLDEETDLIFAERRMAVNLHRVADGRRDALRAQAREWDAAIRTYGERASECDADGRRQ